MAPNGIMSTQKHNNSKIKFTILKLLDDDPVDKTRIYKKIQSEFGLTQSEARSACKEVKIELKHGKYDKSHQRCTW